MQRRLLLVFVLVWLRPMSAWATDPDRRITQYAHTAWRVQDGAFESPPNTIAQTADGYIWIGTDSGLLKYDGVRFVPWAPAGVESPFSYPVYSLLASSDGTLWIGTGRSLLSWRNNNLQEHVRGRINAIVEDRQRRIWVARSRPPDSNGGLCEASGEHPRCVGGDDRMRLPYAETLSEDVHGNLWIGTSNQLMRWRDDSSKPTSGSNWNNTRGSRPWRASLRRETVPFGQPFQGKASASFTLLTTFLTRRCLEGLIRRR